MKPVIITLTVLALLISFIIYNYSTVNGYAAELKHLAEMLPEHGSVECALQIRDLRDVWSSHRSFISFSVGTSALQNVDDLLDSLAVAAEFGTRYDFERYRALLVNAFDGLAQFESLSPEDIF